MLWYRFDCQLFKAVAGEPGASGLPVDDLFHISGDEFKAQADTAGQLIKAFEKAIEYLNNNPLIATFAGGMKASVTLGFSYGIGNTEEEAEKALQAHKSKRLSTGERAGRGEVPPGVVVQLSPEQETEAEEPEVEKGPPLEQDIGTPENINVPALAKRFEGLIDLSKKPLNKVGLQKIVVELFGITRPELIKNPKYSHKDVEEAFEYAIIRKAREIAQKGKGRPYQEVYKDLKRLYKWQPNLATRTSTSVRNQAYSTPIHLAYLMQIMIGIGPNTAVYEPTAGTGSLLTAANPRTVFANELDETRRQILEDQGFNVSDKDGKVAVSKDKVVHPGSMEAVIANPPFGSEEWEKIDGFEIQKLEHKIVIDALKAMSPTGKAAFLIGGYNFEKGKMSNADRIFLNYLNKNYNVIRNINIRGKEYARQGTSFPVRLIVIDGKKTAGATNTFTTADPSNRAEFQRVKTIDELVSETGRIYSGRPTSLAAADGSMEEPASQPSPRPTMAPEQGAGEAVSKPVRGETGLPGGGRGEGAEHGGGPVSSGQPATGVQTTESAESKPGGRGSTAHGVGESAPSERGGGNAPAIEQENQPGGVQARPGSEGGRPGPRANEGGRGARTEGTTPDALSGIANIGVDEVNPADLLDAFYRLYGRMLGLARW